MKRPNGRSDSCDRNCPDGNFLWDAVSNRRSAVTSGPVVSTELTLELASYDVHIPLSFCTSIGAPEWGRHVGDAYPGFLRGR